MNDDKMTLAAALARASEEINKPSTLEETLDAIVQATRASVPGFDQIGISVVHRNGEIETKAGTGQLVWELDALQYGLGEGPCVDSITTPDTVVVEHAPHDQRWPRYMPEAVKHGLRAQLALPLKLEGDTVGGLNLYSTESEQIDPDAGPIAELFATHAAIAFGRATNEQNLNEALTTRKVIGQALGILMERYQIDEDRAFRFLTRASSTSNIKLRIVAEELVITTEERYRG